MRKQLRSKLPHLVQLALSVFLTVIIGKYLGFELANSRHDIARFLAVSPAYADASSCDEVFQLATKLSCESFLRTGEKELSRPIFFTAEQIISWCRDFPTTNFCGRKIPPDKLAGWFFSIEVTQNLLFVGPFPSPEAAFLQAGRTANQVTGDLVFDDMAAQATFGEKVGTDSPTRNSPGLSLRFDGIYQSAQHSNSAHSYLRFYDDGTVISVSALGEASKIARWLNRSNEKLAAGKFNINGNVIRFTTRSTVGEVDWNGVIGDRKIQLESRSRINGHQSTSMFMFLESDRRE